MYSHIIQATGWSWEYVRDHMTLPRLAEMNKYWASFPPVHISAGRIYHAITGTKPTPLSSAAEAEPVKDLNDFISDIMSQGGQVAIVNAPHEATNG
jgi:hypothetical protein